MQEAAHSVMNLIVSKFETGHMLNYAESAYFLRAGHRLDNFVNALKYWWPLTASHLLGVSGTYFASTLTWPGLPGHGRMVGFSLVAGAGVFGSFNSTVCNDTVNFPGSNCSVMGTEVNLLNPATLLP
eukprot:RCo049284